MSYRPEPADLSIFKPSPEIMRDLEAIARDVHEIWAEGRIRAGWGYGAQFNSKNRTHPCLVPYDELPEIEKDMDRATALRTIQMLMKMGYRIEKEQDADPA